MPESKWRSILPTVVAGVATALIVAAITGLVAWLLRDPQPVNVNVALVLDVSEEMRETFGSTTRFEAAVAELAKDVQGRDHDNVSLWTAGGACGSEGARNVVGFRTNNADRIISALEGLEPKGPANLGNAIVSATGGFNDATRYPPTVRKNVVVLTAGRDTCDDRFVRRIRERLEEVGEDLGVRFHFFGLDAPKKLQRRLRGVQREAPNLALHFPETADDLADALEEAQSQIWAPPTASATPTETPQPSEPTESTESTESPTDAPTEQTESP
ncbi:MAG: VWA domain-containing protein [Nitriliruptorales bacterium]|nr:VWA domain-containing protein [Nitriliruptorales bacterium]